MFGSKKSTDKFYINEQTFECSNIVCVLTCKVLSIAILSVCSFIKCVLKLPFEGWSL